MKICYRPQRFNARARKIIADANRILEQMSNDGFAITVRSLYYQFVAHNLFAEDRKFKWTGKGWVKDPNGTINAEPNYKMLIEVLGNARLAGEMDWDLIVDRTRYLSSLSTWTNPADILRSSYRSYRVDAWADQPKYVEIWIEKDALVGVIEGICDQLRVPFFSCRGYTSLSEMHSAAKRLEYIRDVQDKEIHIIHFGDHDPSGCDMSRDIQERIEEFSGGDIDFFRAALTMTQIKQHNPPPNPAKLTDSRCSAYIRKHGDESWELDALPPKVINDLIRKRVTKLTDPKVWAQSMEREEEGRKELEDVANAWPKAVKGARTPDKKKKTIRRK